MSLCLFLLLAISVETATAVHKPYLETYFFQWSAEKTKLFCHSTAMVRISSLLVDITINMLYEPICWLICFTGLVCQIYYISNQYFAFDVTTNVLVTQPTQMIPPGASICIRRYNIDPITRYLNQSETGHMPSTSAIEAQLDIMVSPKEMLELSPDVNTFFTSFQVHTTNGYYLHDAQVDEVVVSKYIKQNDVCYSMKLKQNVIFPAEFMYNSYFGAHYFIMTANMDQMPLARYITFHLYPSYKRYFGFSQSYADLSRKNIDHDTGRSDNNHIQLSYRHFRSVRLPYPYTTKCIHYPDWKFESKEECLNTCLTNLTIKHLKRVPFSVLIDQPIEYNIFTWSESKNETLKAVIAQYQLKCRSRCAHSNCIHDVYSPIVLSSGPAKHMLMDLMASNSPTIVVTYTPIILLIDYVTFLLSCISFWIGWSPLGFMFDVKRWVKKKYSKVDPRIKSGLEHRLASMEDAVTNILTVMRKRQLNKTTAQF